MLFDVFDAKKRRTRRRPSLIYGGDDQDAKAVAATLIRDVGFDPADAGRLRIARYLEAFALAMAQLAYEGDNGPEIAYRIERSSLAPNRSRMDTIDSNQQFIRRLVEFINTADSTMARDLVSPNALRGLIDAIVLTPRETELKIELQGNLAAMLKAAQAQTTGPSLAPLGRWESERSSDDDDLVQIMLVAGAGFEPATFGL